MLPVSGRKKKKEQFRSAFFMSLRQCFWERSNQTIIATGLPSDCGFTADFPTSPGWLRVSPRATVAAPLYSRRETPSGANACCSGRSALFVCRLAACAIAPNLAMLIGARGCRGLVWRPHDLGASAHRRSRFSKRGEGVSRMVRANFGPCQHLGPVLAASLAHLGWRQHLLVNIPLGWSPRSPAAR